MTCEACEKFPVPSAKFRELATSLDRHGTLFSCKECGQFIEVIAEERAHKNLSVSEAKIFYADLESLN